MRFRWMFLIGMGSLAALGCGGEPAEDEGAHEEEGPPRVELDPRGVEMAGIRIGAVDTVRSGTITVTGTIAYDPKRISHVGPKTEGRIVALRTEVGSVVRRGQVLALLESAEVGAIRAEHQEAQALLAIDREHYEREQRLEARGISSRRELLEARADLSRAEAAAMSARTRLAALGAESGTGGQFVVTAPFAGVVVQQHATPGEVAGPADQLFTVADLSGVWIDLFIFERDLPRVRRGQAVRVTTPAYPEREFVGRIEYVGDVLDPERRAARARIEIDNADRALKPGMFARAVIEVPADVAAVVPRDAVQTIEGEPSVWIPMPEPGAFRARPVEIGDPVDDERVRVLAGLAPGDSIVVTGAFALKAELSKGEFGGHGH